MKIEWKTVNLDSFQNISKSLTKLFLKKSSWKCELHLN